MVIYVWVLVTSVLWAGSTTAGVPPAAGVPAVGLTATDVPPAGVPQCRLHTCQYLGRNKTNDYFYEVEGNQIGIRHDTQKHPALVIDCSGANILDSPALPRIEPSFRLKKVQLWNCPLPAVYSLKEALTTLNFEFCDSVRDESDLSLHNIPSTPPLSTKHFSGFNCLQVLTIDNINSITPGVGFLKPLRNLHELNLRHISLIDEELERSMPDLEILWLYETGLKRLPEVIYCSVNLHRLTIVELSPIDAGAVPPGARQLALESPATSLRLEIAPALETLRIFNWIESLPKRITSCGQLRKVLLKAPAMLALPDGWLTNCSRLEVLEISEARNLTTLPPTMLAPWNEAFSRLTLKQGVLETLPERLIYNLPGLQYLDLRNNHLQTLPSQFFKWFNFRLMKVDLSWNELDSLVMEALALIWSRSKPSYDSGLAVLDLSNNPRIGDVCGGDGYSRLRLLTGLHQLLLRGTGVTRICKDWREKMTSLELLDLTNTSVTQLSFDDLQYTRNIKAQVMLWGAPVTELRVTNEDYNKATLTQPSFTFLRMSIMFDCDCRLYWARRILEPPLTALNSISRLQCTGGCLLRDVTPESLECPAPKECGAASLQDGCVCALRPDDDPAQDRWLVMTRCQNSSEFVPRRMYPFYPFYPLYQSNKLINQGYYFTQNVISLN